MPTLNKQTGKGKPQVVQLSERIQTALQRVPSMHLQALVTLKQNAQKYGLDASPLIDAIDERMRHIGGADALARGRLEFARNMLRIVSRSRPGNWVSSRDLFRRAQVENADNYFVVWMQDNTARQIPITKALADVLPEFPEIERRKDGNEQGGRVYFRRRA